MPVKSRAANQSNDSNHHFIIFSFIIIFSSENIQSIKILCHQSDTENYENYTNN
jgi:hypothetical protein